MQKMLPVALSCVLLLGGACQSSDSKVPQEPAATAAEPVTPPAAAGGVPALVADPQVGDVYVVQYQPQGTAEQRYFFYHLYRVTPDSAYLHPARKEATDPAADLRQPDFQPSEKTLVYTRAELAELVREQPGDALKIKLIQVRRGQ